MFTSTFLIALIQTAGYLGIFGIVFAESGILVGFFLPGDSLLFTAGILASQGYLQIGFLIFIIAAGAILGDNVGYAFGRKVGPKIFYKEDSKFFHKDNLLKAEEFYRRHGVKTIILARFIPFARTFAPIVAGVGRMNYRVFLFYNILGGALWALALPLAGYYLGRAVSDIDRFILPIILGIVMVSLLPPAYHYARSAYAKKISR